jgi:hypothetical protein
MSQPKHYWGAQLGVLGGAQRRANRTPFGALLTLVSFATILFCQTVSADVGEISVLGAYSKSNFGGGNFTRTRRYTASFALNLTSITEIEASYMYSDSFYNQSSGPVQTISTNEQSLALSLVQTLVPASWPIQPYVKAGAAQYNRRQRGTEDGVATREVSTKSPSAVVGAGLRIILFGGFSVKGEVTSIIADFRWRDAKNNVNAQVGLGWNF